MTTAPYRLPSSARRRLLLRGGVLALGLLAAVTVSILLLPLAGDAAAQALEPPADPNTPVGPAGGDPSAGGIQISVDMGESGDNYVGAIKIVLLLAAIGVAPSLLLAMTSFTRIVVVLSLLRQAVGVVQLPPNRVVIGLSLFLTMFTMAPVWSQIDAVAIQPMETGALNERQALEAALDPVRQFLMRQTSEDDLALFISMSNQPRPANPTELSTFVLIPAFMLSELKAAFQMGALLFLPFLVIDLVVASVLMSMGMMMLPPMTISLPLKLLVFVMVDGWGLVMKSLAESVVM